MNGRPRMAISLVLAAMACAVAVNTATARTIELGSDDINGIGIISPDEPRLSWASYGRPRATGVHGSFTSSAIELHPDRVLLMRYDLSSIPEGMRITHAEWVLPFPYHRPREARLVVHRANVSWGMGVCHDYRTTRPEPVPWTLPGARGIGSDRALRSTARPELTGQSEDITVNVTRDVELWYKDGASNHGWIVTVEDADTYFRFISPLLTGYDRWLLRITYEPE